MILLLVCRCIGSELRSKVIITDSDLATIKGLSSRLEEKIKSVSPPPQSSIGLLRGAIEEIKNDLSYQDLLKFGPKLLPYLIQQIQVSQECRWLVGSALAERKIKDQADLYKYQKERQDRLRQKIVLPLPMILLQGIEREKGVNGNEREMRVNSSLNLDKYWLKWWSRHQDEFELQTAKPLFIDGLQNYAYEPQINSSAQNGLITIEAVSASYPQIIERAAAEVGIEVFIGEQEYMDILTSVRMRSVTFEEFAYLIGLTVSVNPFKYTKTETGYLFGGEKKAPPRVIMNGWGIAMEKTVFAAGETIPVIVVARGKGDMISPFDPVFDSYGSFQVTDNRGKIIQGYLPKDKIQPTLPLVNRKEDCTRIYLNLPQGKTLPPGEYNIKFKYLYSETPPIAFKIFPGHAKTRIH